MHYMCIVLVTALIQCKPLGDKAVQNGTLLFTDDATIQCVAVSITSVPPGSNGESCLSMSLSTTSTVSGLTISPSLATICIVPTEGE